MNRATGGSAAGRRLAAVLAALAPLLLAALVVAHFGGHNRAIALSLIEGVLKATIPLALCGVAVAIGFRAGVFNLGAEGQLVAGAVAATAVGVKAPLPGALLLPAELVAAMLAGAAWSALAAWLKRSRGVPEVLATILLNFVAIQAVAWAVQGPLQEASQAYPQSDAFPAAARLPALGRLHAGVPIAFAASLALAWLLFRTPLGFRLRAVGHAPLAARFAGIPPERHGIAALAIAGALAGAAGAFEVAGVTGRLYQGLSPGFGYTAIAVALLARLHPLAVVPSAFFFGALEAGAGAMQREAGIPSVATEVVQGLVILLSVSFALARKR